MSSSSVGMNNSLSASMLNKFIVSRTIEDNSPSHLGDEMNNADFAKFNNKFSSSSNLYSKQKRNSALISFISVSLSESKVSQAKSFKNDTRS